MPMLTLKLVVAGLVLLTAIQLIGKWVSRRKRQRRASALKQWIYKQDQPPVVIYRKVEIRLAQQRESE
jgi:hypothetical protein